MNDSDEISSIGDGFGMMLSELLPGADLSGQDCYEILCKIPTMPGREYVDCEAVRRIDASTLSMLVIYANQLFERNDFSEEIFIESLQQGLFQWSGDDTMEHFPKLKSNLGNRHPPFSEDQRA